MKLLLLLLLASGLSMAEMDPSATVWKTVPSTTVALYRTPPVHAEEPPAVLEIPAARMQVLKAGGKTVVRLEWADTSRNTAVAGPGAFTDACAVMIPARPISGDVFPSLQMGDGGHPVLIYYYDAVRGAAVMEASGRGTTRRTGQEFPARALYAAGRWQVILELPELPPGTPLSIAVWNGSQQDRDGRKYFSIWQKIP